MPCVHRIENALIVSQWRKSRGIALHVWWTQNILQHTANSKQDVLSEQNLSVFGFQNANFILNEVTPNIRVLAIQVQANCMLQPNLRASRHHNYWAATGASSAGAVVSCPVFATMVIKCGSSGKSCSIFGTIVIVWPNTFFSTGAMVSSLIK